MTFGIRLAFALNDLRALREPALKCAFLGEYFGKSFSSEIGRASGHRDLIKLLKRLPNDG
jgi:hypothetical protein